MIKLVLGDCLSAMKALEANSIDTIITDPPYGLGFMGKMWDHGVPGIPFWEAALRVAKPGAMLLAFGGTRTSHRLTCAIEDAGWEIRDSIIWLYASGFPKSHDISKAIDKAAGKEREVVGESLTRTGKSQRDGMFTVNLNAADGISLPITAPATEAAALWEGWGTALAPSHEPIIMAMKPREGTFANNALTHGVAGLWIDGGRIATGGEGWTFTHTDKTSRSAGIMGNVSGARTGTEQSHPQGRWPKNVIFSHHPDCVERGVRRVRGTQPRPMTGTKRQIYGGGEGLPDERDYNPTHTNPDGLETVADWDCHPGCPVRMLAEQSGKTSYTGPRKNNRVAHGTGPALGFQVKNHGQEHHDTGTAARFFKCFSPEVYCVLCDLPITPKNGTMTATQAEVVSCASVKSAGRSSSPSVAADDSVASHVLPSGRPDKEGKSDSFSTLAKPVASSGKTTQETNGCIALENALLRAVDASAQNAKSAASLCKKCVTAIAQSIVAMQQGQSPDSLLGKAFISEHKRQILTRNLALLVESQESIGTIPTIAALKLLFGSVNHAITTSIEVPTTASGPGRFRYQGKASRKERNLGLEGEGKKVNDGRQTPIDNAYQRGETLRLNTHPTVKPLSIMRYLCKLTQNPFSGVVFDPFMGSGTTGMAAVLEGRDFIGIEINQEYLEIAEKRIAWAEAQPVRLL